MLKEKLSQLRINNYKLRMNTNNNAINNTIDQTKKNTLFLILTAIFLTNVIVAEIIGMKVIALYEIFGLPYKSIEIWKGFSLDLVIPVGVILWPIVFIVSDVMNEYFGQKGIKKASYLTSIMVLYTFAIINITTSLPASQSWISFYKESTGKADFDINFAFNTIIGQSGVIMIASIVTFLIGQLLDALVFQKIKNITGEKYFWLRANGSTFFSQLIDSFLVITLAFYLYPKIMGQKAWDVDFLFSVGINNYIYKMLIGVALTPVLYLVHHFVDKYLQIKQN